MKHLISYLPPLAKSLGISGMVSALIGVLFFFQLEISAFHTHRSPCDITETCHTDVHGSECESEHETEHEEHSCQVCIFKASLHSVLATQPFILSDISLTQINYLHRGILLTLSYLTHLHPSRAPPQQA